MKHTLFSVLVLGTLIIPLTSQAHMGQFTSQTTTSTTQGYTEHIESIMNKMMEEEELTKTELQEMASFMESSQNYTAMPYTQMMSNNAYYPHNFSTMHGLFMYWVMPITMIVWLLIGILLTIILVKKITSQKHA